MLGDTGPALVMGLMNQHLSIVNFLTLGIAVGADELMVTAARSRSNFSASASWESRDVSEIWNVTKIAQFFASRAPGLHCGAFIMCNTLCTLMIRTFSCRLTTFLNLAGRNITFISGKSADHCTWHLADVDLDWQHPSEFGDVAGFVRQMIKQRQTEAAARPKSGQVLQSALTSLLTSTISLNSRVHTEAARHVTFTETLEGFAFKAISRLRAETGIPGFNGVHLRIEDDFSHVKDAGAGLHVEGTVCS